MITVIDSGIGGVSVLRELRKLLPHVAMRYFGDTAFMPYGNKTPLQLFHRITNILSQCEDDSDLFVIACNSASVSLVDDYRAQFDIPFIGVEPGVKPAAAMTKTGHIALLATPRTIQSPQIPRLIEQFGKGKTFHLIACKHLAEAIEREPERIPDVIAEDSKRIPAEVDTVILGSTHYLLIADAFQKYLGPEKTIINIAPAVARYAAEKYHQLPTKHHHRDNNIRFECSGDEQQFLQRIRDVAPELFMPSGALPK